MPTGNPAGYYQVPGLPYPGRPGIPQPAVDPNDLIATAAAEQDAARTAMRPDAGISAMAPRDPFMTSLPPRQPAVTQTVTRLAPGRTTPFSRADAQALAALDPRALNEATALAALPESTPAKITGSFGGQSFEMQPSARVDRNALARLYAQAQERKGQERQDDVRRQEQGGRERIVSIPGEQQTKRTELELGAKERMAGAEREATAPERAAKIKALEADTAAGTAKAGREQQEFTERITPEQKAIDDELAAAQASPFASTPAGQARIRALQSRSTVGKTLPPAEAAAVASGGVPQQDIGTATAEALADPGIAALIKRAQETEPGFFTGSRGRQTGTAARLLAERAIRARLQRAGASPEDIAAAITSILKPPTEGVGGNASAALSLAPNFISGPIRAALGGG